MNHSYSFGHNSDNLVQDIQIMDEVHDKSLFSENNGKVTMDTDYLNFISNSGFLHAFLASLSVIIVSELGDKTFFIAAILAMKNSRTVVFVASMLALGIMTILASVMGVATSIIPRVYIHYTSVALFFVFGLKMLKEGYDLSDEDAKEELNQVQTSIEKEEQNSKQAPGLSRDASTYSSEDPETGVIKSLPEVPLRTRIRRKFLVFVSLTFIKTFTMIFLAEWGDRSQISTVVLAARENAYAVTAGALLGHTLCTGLAVVGGRFVAQLISVKAGKFEFKSKKYSIPKSGKDRLLTTNSYLSINDYPVTIVGGFVFLIFSAVAIIFGQ